MEVGVADEKDEKDLKNGANLIVNDGHGGILVVREKTRKQMWMLPGGEVERGESPRHAAQSETEEESGIVTDEADYRLFGVFVQRPKGLVLLYGTGRFSGDIIVPTTSNEVSEARFMVFEEIVDKVEEFRTAYLRMILRYRRCMFGIDTVPFEGRLSDPVEFPRRLDGATYNDVILRV